MAEISEQRVPTTNIYGKGIFRIANNYGDGLIEIDNHNGHDQTIKWNLIGCLMDAGYHFYTVRKSEFTGELKRGEPVGEWTMHNGYRCRSALPAGCEAFLIANPHTEYGAQIGDIYDYDYANMYTQTFGKLKMIFLKYDFPYEGR